MKAEKYKKSVIEKPGVKKFEYFRAMVLDVSLLDMQVRRVFDREIIHLNIDPRAHTALLSLAGEEISMSAWMHNDSSGTMVNYEADDIHIGFCFPERDEMGLYQYDA